MKLLPSAMGKSMYAVLGLWLGHLFDQVKSLQMGVASDVIL